MSSAPRIAPGGRREIGLLNTIICTVGLRVVGARTGNLFTTMARRPKLFRAWLRFGGTMMPRGGLDRRETELAILRVATLRNCTYEFAHHLRLSAKVGIDDADIERVKVGASAGGWSEREGLLLEAADSIHATQNIDDELWQRMAGAFSDADLVEVTMLLAHYEMLATFIATLRIKDDIFR